MASMETSGLPSRATILSSSFSPPLAAGELGSIWPTMTGSSGNHPAEPTSEVVTGLGHDGFLEGLISPLNGDGQRLIRTEPHPGLQLFPGRVHDAIDLYDPVAWLQAGPGGRRSRASLPR